MTSLIIFELILVEFYLFEDILVCFYFKHTQIPL